MDFSVCLHLCYSVCLSSSRHSFNTCCCHVCKLNHEYFSQLQELLICIADLVSQLISFILIILEMLSPKTLRQYKRNSLHYTGSGAAPADHAVLASSVTVKGHHAGSTRPGGARHPRQELSGAAYTLSTISSEMSIHPAPRHVHVTCVLV